MIKRNKKNEIRLAFFAFFIFLKGKYKNEKTSNNAKE